MDLHGGGGGFHTAQAFILLIKGEDRRQTNADQCLRVSTGEVTNDLHGIEKCHDCVPVSSFFFFFLKKGFLLDEFAPMAPSQGCETRRHTHELGWAIVCVCVCGAGMDTWSVCDFYFTGLFFCCSIKNISSHKFSRFKAHFSFTQPVEVSLCWFLLSHHLLRSWRHNFVSCTLVQNEKVVVLLLKKKTKKKTLFVLL